MKSQAKLIQAFLVGVLLAAGSVAQGQSAGATGGLIRHERVARELSRADVKVLESLPTLTVESLQTVGEVTAPAALAAQIEQILSQGTLSVGARDVDETGRSHVHRYIAARIEQINERMRQHTDGQAAQVEFLGTLEGLVAANVPLDKLRYSQPDSGGVLRVGEQSFPLTALWPNGAMPSITPADGLTGELVYVGRGGWSDVQGLELRDRIVLMDFGGGRNWERLFSLGIQAVIVIEDEFVSRENAEGLAMHTPVPCPRYYVSREVGQELIALADRKEYLDQSEWRLVRGAGAALLQGGSTFEQRRWISPFYYLPPTAPQTYTIAEADLLSRIADDYEIGLADLLAYNNLSRSANIAAGATIRIPGQQRPYRVRDDDLLIRIATSFDMTLDELRRANAGATGLEAGQRLRIPNIDQTLVLLVPIDSVNVVSDVPHGAGPLDVPGFKIASNLAVALTTLEHLATEPGTIRRKGLMLALLDAESIGGMSSRTFGQYVLMHRGNWAEQLVAGRDPAQAIDRYQRAAEFFDKLDGELSSAAGTDRWLVNEWLHVRAEQSRVQLAERRIAARVAQHGWTERFRRTNEAIRRAEREGDSEAAQEHRQRLADLERQWEIERPRLEAEVADTSRRLEALFEYRDETLDARASNSERVRNFLRGLPQTPEEMEATLLEINRQGIRQRLERELQEERVRQELHQHNLGTIERVLSRLHPATPSNEMAPVTALGMWLDLTDGSWNLGLTGEAGTSLNRSVAMTPTSHGGQLSRRYRLLNAYASREAGWDEPWTFVSPEEDKQVFSATRTEEPPVHGQFWTLGEVAAMVMGTYNDRLERLDTPHDTLGMANMENFSLQARSLLMILTTGMANTVDSRGPQRVPTVQYGRLVGMVTQFNALSGIDAQEPVAGALVYYSGHKTTPVVRNSNFTRGVRRGVALLTPLNGTYLLPLEDTGSGLAHHGFVYMLDRQSGLFSKVMEEGQIGTQVRTHKFTLTNREDTQRQFVMTDVYPLVFFPGPDPRDYNEIGATGGGQYTEIIDVILSGTPRHYGYDNPGRKYAEQDVLSNIIYMPPGRRVRVMTRQMNFFKVLLVGEVTPEQPKGRGYRVGPGENGERNLTLPMTPLLIARDMLQLAETRQRIYAEHGVTDQSSRASIMRAREKYELASAAFEQLDYQSANGYSRESWGILINSYSRVLTLGREAVFSAVVLMALLLPASVFVEKLLVGGKGIIAKLVGTTTVFAAGTIFLNFFHPAFEISVSPFIVVIAFTMILMSLIVLVISYQRFDVLVRRARAAGGEVESEEISLTSSLATALSLGVSNLKKRPARTFLTVFTVTVLTFSIVTFVSVRGEDSLTLRTQRLDPLVEGRESPVEPLEPAYEGVMFRQFFWAALSDNFVSAINSEFGSRFPMTTRGHYLQVEGGNNAAREGVNQEQVGYGDREAIVTGIMTMMPNEPQFTGLNRAVTGGAWFRDTDRQTGRPADRHVIILPDNVAADLGITVADLLVDVDAPEPTWRPREELPVVRLKNQDWTVIGILDTAHADRLRDVNGKPVSMVHYLKSAYTPSAGEGDLINESDGYYITWRELVIVPHAAAGDVAAKPRSVVIAFGPDDDIVEFQGDAAMRINRAMFGHSERLAEHFGTGDNRIFLMTTRTRQSVAGLAKIIVPVILCVLIVLNTMMANVEERRGEVGMLGAIGLSPSQISFLLLSESAVFSVLGIVLGLFGGLLFANVIKGFPELLGSLSFNFTSLLSMALAMGTGVVVLLATLIPARRAAAMAAPSGMGHWELPESTEEGEIQFDLPFTLTRGNAVGMMAFFRRFLLNHSDAASSDFNCRNVHMGIAPYNGSESLRITCIMWLAPYDLDVAQRLSMSVTPTENEGVFGVRILLHRTSGTEEAWLRTNYGFMDLVRRQFLFWRNLDNQARKDYIVQGAQLFQQQEQEAVG